MNAKLTPVPGHPFAFGGVEKMRIVRSFFLAVAVIAGCALCERASAQPYVVDFFPDDVEVNHILQLRFIGPIAGQITQTRLFIDFTTAAGFNAEDLAIQLVAPVMPDDPNGGFWFLTGEDLGWSGQGTFHAQLNTNLMNGQLVQGLWGFDLGSINDPPAYSGSFSPTTRFEVDIVIPEPTTGVVFPAGVGAITLLRRRRLSCVGGALPVRGEGRGEG
jgi:hypothetical protein